MSTALRAPRERQKSNLGKQLLFKAFACVSVSVCVPACHSLLPTSPPLVASALRIFAGKWLLHIDPLKKL